MGTNGSKIGKDELRKALIEELHGPEMELKKGESFTLANIYNAKVVQPKTVKQERKVGF